MRVKNWKNLELLFIYWSKILGASKLNGGNGHKYFVVLIKTIIFKYITGTKDSSYFKEKGTGGIIDVIL